MMKASVVALALAFAAAGPAVLEAKEKKKGETVTATETNQDVIARAEEKALVGDLDGAIALLKQKVGASDAAPELLVAIAGILESKYDLEAAVDTLKQAAQSSANPAIKGEALGRLAVLEEIRSTGNASETAAAAVAAAPEGVWPLIALSRANARAEQADKAMDLADKAAAGGGGAAALAARAFAFEAKGNLPAAETAYQESRALATARVEASIGLARVLRRTGRAAEAEPLLQDLLRRAPDLVAAYKEAARVKLALDRVDEAMNDAVTAAVMAPDDPESQQLRLEVSVAKALAFVKANQAELAIEDLTSLRDANPRVALVRIGLARAYAAKQQADPAIAELLKAIDIDPARAEAHFELGRVRHLLKHDAPGAVLAYEKAVALAPGDADYRVNLGAVLSDLKQYDRAAAELGKVVEGPGSSRPDAWIYLGGAHLGAKRYREAVTALDKGLALAPNEVMACAYLAWAYLGLKDAENFKTYGAKAKALGYADAGFLDRLTRVEKGEPIK